MYKCQVEQGDVVIDHQAYRLINLGQLKTVQRLVGYRGVSFVDFQKTHERLVETYLRHRQEHRRQLRQERLERARMINELLGQG